MPEATSVALDLTLPPPLDIKERVGSQTLRGAYFRRSKFDLSVLLMGISNYREQRIGEYGGHEFV